MVVLRSGRCLRRRSLLPKVSAVVLVALFGGSVVIGSAAMADPGPARCGSGETPAAVSSRGPWTLITPPVQAALTSYAVAPDRPKVMMATDGAAVYRSVDAGTCWASVMTHGYLGGKVPTAGLPTALDAVRELGMSATGSVVFAAVSPCKTRRPVPDVPGCTVLVSVDGGALWSERSSGLPLTISSIDTLRVSDRGSTAYVVVTNLDGSQSLYGTDDAGVSWTLRSDIATSVLVLDPADPHSVWRGGLALSHSVDGGRTWRVADSAPTGVLALDVQHRSPSEPAVLTVSQSGQSLRSTDGGRSWTVMNDATGTPAGGFTSFAHLQDGTVAAINAVPRDLSLSRDGARWRELTNGASRLSLASADRAASPAFYFRNDPDEIAVYDPAAETGTGEGGSPETPLTPEEQSRRGEQTDRCYNGKGNNLAPPAPPGPVQAAPPGTVIYVTNFQTGCVAEFDRNGHSRIVFQGPQWSEGIALGFDGQLTIGTRFSNLVVRTQFPSVDRVNRLAKLSSAEGPSFDQNGNLFIVDNGANVVYELPYPQPPAGASDAVLARAARPIWTFGTNHFLEDTRIAPASSPFAGSLFVMYSDRSRDPNAIAVLQRRGNGWTRTHDFARLPFGSLGMAFAPDGAILVAEYGGPRIARIAPDGKTTTIFADLGPDYMLAKLDVTAAGDVYATSNVDSVASLLAPRPPISAVARLDATGKRLYPDFTENLSYPVGITVPNVITGHPLLRPVPLRPPPAGVNPPPADPPPPVQAPQPQVQPGPVSAPVPAPAPAPAPAAQPQANPVSQANPVAQSVPQVGLVPQKQTQAQLATVQVQAEPAAQRNEYLMSRRQRSQPIPAPAALLAVGFVACCLQTRAWVVHSRVSTAPLRGRR
jgi:photosystem II stability/assembly factor-like uncharacterized protein